MYIYIFENIYMFIFISSNYTRSSQKQEMLDYTGPWFEW